ncbi:Uncharacterised protein [Chlamydia trachomatis]|nr:Uncharacterised protein [Chlamydia trachomatis]
MLNLQPDLSRAAVLSPWIETPLGLHIKCLHYDSSKKMILLKKDLFIYVFIYY